MRLDLRTCCQYFVAIVMALLACAGVTPAAQSNPGTPAVVAGGVWDVISIRPRPAGPVRNVSSMLPGGRFHSESTLRQLIRYAYGLQPSQHLVGASKVLDERDVIDAQAIAEQALTADSHLPMVRALLADRFKLRVRIEKEVRVVAAIVRRQSDGPGPHLRALTEDCAVARQQESDALQNRPRCTFTLIDGQLKAVVPNMADFARRLSYAGRAFVDETGLNGPFEIEMRFDPASLNEKYAEATPSQLPSFADALRTELGLRLETQRRPVSMLIVENVEVPTPN